MHPLLIVHSHIAAFLHSNEAQLIETMYDPVLNFTDNMGSLLSKHCIRNFSYKSQTCAMALGISFLITGFVFLLIAVGASALLWKVLGCSFVGLGLVLTLSGGIWCYVAVRRNQEGNHRELPATV